MHQDWIYQMHQDWIYQMHQDSIYQMHQDSIYQMHQDSIYQMHQDSIYQMHQDSIYQISASLITINTSNKASVITSLNLQNYKKMEWSLDNFNELDIPITLELCLFRYYYNQYVFPYFRYTLFNKKYLLVTKAFSSYATFRILYSYIYTYKYFVQLQLQILRKCLVPWRTAIIHINISFKT